MWIIPGARSLCVATIDKTSLPFLAGTATGMGCSRDVASALSYGSGVSNGEPGRVTWNYCVLPNTKPTLMIRTGSDHHKTIHRADGVYIYRTAT